MTQPKLADLLAGSMTKPSAARVYDYLIGGGHCFAVDREFAETKLKPLLPRIGDYAMENRQWLARVVRRAVRNGYRQFVDIGSGLPSTGNVHEIADECRPAKDARVVYLDNEPVAHAYGQVILEENGDPERHVALQADLLDSHGLWQSVQNTGLIDLDEPVVLLMAAVLHFIKDKQDPDRHLQYYRDQLPAQSILALSSMTNENPTSEDEAQSLQRLVAFYEETTNPGQLRNHDELIRFFGDWPLLDPGLVYVPEWHPDGATEFPGNPSASRILGGVAQKPQH
ncbi:MAG TPA: SAM-dependent methyltransferase [Pseudonocardiaceae bacterium]